MTDNQIDSDFSRRSLVKTAAVITAAGGALALAGPAATAVAADSAAKGEQVPDAGAPQHQPQAAAMVHVRDGVLDIHTANGTRTVKDPALAARLTNLGR